ncbi:MAG: PAS domain S-box protein [Candidatus Thermoplasmatota archaeon]|nr:PAS domain S-box protein [Candidatus Thermoplasmatota archaeon]MDD5778599.1 PAS domain S-box protein [Candidatus Thermoplasmatota archaeon]
MDGDADMRSEALLTILDHIPVGIVSMDGEGRVTYANRQVRHLLEAFSATAPLTEHEVVAASPFASGLSQLLAASRPFSGVLWEHRDCCFSVDGVPCAGGALLIVHDVTERVRAEQALREQEEKYRLLTENAPTGIVMVEEGICVFANRRFAQMTGYGDGLVGRPLTDVVHAGDVAAVQRCLSGRRRQGAPRSFRLVTRGHDIVWVECSVSPVCYEGRDALLVNLMDVSREKQMEEKLHLSRKQMEDVAERERRFIEDLSHYFFNPLCIAKGYIDLSLREADPALRRKLEITREAVDRVETVVKHVVTEGRIYE